MNNQVKVVKFINCKCQIPQEIIDLIETSEVPKVELELKNKLVTKIKSLGYEAIAEYPISYIRTSKRNIVKRYILKGRIDIVVSKGDIKFGIEIDIAHPKTKSIDKLEQSEFGGIIVLRRYRNKTPCTV